MDSRVGHIDPDLSGLSEAERIRLSGLGVYLDGPIGSRLQREVEARWAGRSDESARGWRDRDRLAAEAVREFVADAERARRNFRNLIYLAAVSWMAICLLLVWLGR